MAIGVTLLARAFQSLHGGGVAWNKLLCSRYRWRHSTCHSCLQACPENALAFGDGLAIDPEKCNGCGICLARCPNGALQSARTGDQALLARMSVFLSESRQGALRLACEKHAGGPNTFTVSCLGRRTAPLLVGPFCAGVQKVEIARPDCSGCHGRLDVPGLEKTVFLAQSICHMAGLGNQTVVFLAQQPDTQEGPKEQEISRRGAARILKVELRNALSSFFVQPAGEKELSPWARQPNVSRELLLTLVRGLGRRGPVTIDREGLPLAEVEISRGCVGCGVCSTLCPAGAIHRLERDDSIFLSFHPQLCTACGICVEACLPKAISFKSRFDLGKLGSAETEPLSILPGVKCAGCQTDFFSAGEPLCLACRVRNDAGPGFPLNFNSQRN